ncbi:MAG: ribonuclease R [Anaerohalosphaeraceae bacterium]|nr:ribonuclease R [Anaerohalosphaeraceae bacterium]
MIDIFKKQILRILTHSDYQPGKIDGLAKSVGANENDYDDFKKAVKQLRSEGRLVVSAKNAISLPGISEKIHGLFRANPKGFGFVIPAEANACGDLFIPPDKTKDAMTGDRVIAKVIRNERGRKDARINGEIIEILERATNRLVGTIAKKRAGFFLRPDGKAFAGLWEITDITAKNAQPGDKAVVEIIDYPKEGQPGSGVIVEMLGKAGCYETEIKAVVRQFQLPGEFGEDCARQASEEAKSFDADGDSGRLDLTEKVIITIDPPDAKDFDDAISIDKNADGSFTLGVHIADVSTFVGGETPLDVEAAKRGNSVYLPRRTIPMLPEVLSNGICSLQPGQKRFTKSAFITYDTNGKVLKSEFANAVICSNSRLTYLQANKILNGKKDEAVSCEATALLSDMNTLAKIIEQRRRKTGMLHLDLPETELVFDKAGRVVDAKLADDSYPHTIIEMFMVEANEAAARVLRGAKVPNMRRIHPDPDSLSLKGLAQTLKMLGYSIGKDVDRFSLQGLLDKVKGTPESLAVNTYVLRSLSRAEYSPLNIGHYALASKDYGHFTSPIRRYADLLVHRLLDLYIKGKLKTDSKNIKAVDELSEIGKHITLTERRAGEAENDLKKVLILIMLQERIGDEIDTVVSGVSSFGLFLRCRKFGIEGLVPLEMLGDDNFKYDQKGQCVYGENSGITIRLGKEIRAKIVSVNLAARQLNLTVAEQLVTEKKSRKKKKNHKTRNTKKRSNSKRRKKKRK